LSLLERFVSLDWMREKKKVSQTERYGYLTWKSWGRDWDLFPARNRMLVFSEERGELRLSNQEAGISLTDVRRGPGRNAAKDKFWNTGVRGEEEGGQSVLEKILRTEESLTIDLGSSIDGLQKVI